MFFEKINKIDKPLARLITKKERGDITTDTMETKRVIKEYYEQFYAHKFDNLDEIDRFLERRICQNSHKKKQTI